MRKLLPLVLAITVLAAVAATGTASASNDSRDATAGFKFGVILPTSSTDLNWSQTMTSASRDVAKQLGAKLSLTDKVFDPTQARPLFNQLLGQKTKLDLRPQLQLRRAREGARAQEPGHDLRRRGGRREGRQEHLDLDLQLPRDGLLAVLARGQALGAAA